MADGSSAAEERLARLEEELAVVVRRLDALEEAVRRISAELRTVFEEEELVPG